MDLGEVPKESSKRGNTLKFRGRVSGFKGLLPQRGIVRRGGQEAVCSTAMGRCIEDWCRESLAA